MGSKSTTIITCERHKPHQNRTEVPVIVYRQGKTFTTKAFVGDFEQFQKLIETPKP